MDTKAPIWVPFFYELFKVICSDYDAAKLYKVWNNYFPNKYIDIDKMDPFTFIARCLRGQKEDTKFQYCKKLKEDFKLASEAPVQYEEPMGMPSLKGSFAFFCKQYWNLIYEENYSESNAFNQALKPLWDLAQQVLNGNIQEKTYDTCINLTGAGKSLLTQVIFICNPYKFYALDNVNKKYLNDNGEIYKSEKNYKSFMDFQTKALKINSIPYEFSINAFLNSGTNKSNGGKTIKQPLNQILYGPPGTGKTYNTVVKAMEIIGIPKEMSEEYSGEKDIYDKLQEKIKNSIKEKQKYEDYEYEILKKEFDKQLGKQIEFITFHQSYSYEEFVEGIRPNVPDGDLWGDEADDVKYLGKNGIFKRICKKAKNPIIKKDNNFALNDSPKIWKVSLMSSGENSIRTDCMNNNYIRIGFDEHGEIITEETKFYARGKNVLNAFINKMKIGDIVLSCYSADSIDAIGVVTSDYYWNEEFDRYKRVRNVNWLVKGLNYNILNINDNKSFSDPTVQEAINMSLKDVINIINEKVDNNGDIDSLETEKNYVLIIDEINRGNISKIFGELITLIEDDKREGEDNAITVTLPYSGEPFSVPNNLYIIGTMNTADRSIALLDTALRRRFDFEEMMPQESLLRGKIVKEIEIDLEKFLTNLNRNICTIGHLDKDHKIGHAFLINVDKGTAEEQREKLKRAFLNKIYPLLQEYFYDDDKTMINVLGGFNNLDKIYVGDNWLEAMKKVIESKQ